MAQYALDRVLSVAGSDVVTEDLVFFADQIVDPSLSFTSETEDIVDALNNVVMVLENGRGCTFSASNAFFNTEILAAQVGSKVGARSDILDDGFEMYEIVTIGANRDVTPKGRILGDADGEFLGKVYLLSEDGSVMAASAVPVTYTAEEGMVGLEGYKKGTIVLNETTITTFPGVKKVLVKYTTKVSATSITAFADAKNALMNVTAEVLLRDLCKEELYYAYIIMRGKLSGEAEWSMTRDGNHGFEIRCLPEYCGNKKLVEVIIVKGE